MIELAWKLYWSIAAVHAGFVLGFSAAEGSPMDWRAWLTTVLTGAFWPCALLAGWVMERRDRKRDAGGAA